MSLNKPVEEIILDNIATRLAGIDDSSVVRYRREPGHWTPDDRQIIVHKGDIERLPELDHPGNPPAVAWMMTVNLYIHIQQSEHSTDDNTPIVSEFVHDVYKRITCVDEWYQWSGTAINTDIGTLETSSPSGSFDSMKLPLFISYRYSEGNPYEVRA